MTPPGPSLQSWLWRWALTLGVLGVVLLLGGLALPRTYVVERSTTVQAAPVAVYALVADPRRWHDWMAWGLHEPSARVVYAGPSSGAGAGWSWQGEGRDAGTLRFTAAEPAHRLAYELHFADGDSRFKGELRLKAQGSGTELSWVMTGDAGAQPLLRWRALLMDRQMGKGFEQGLMNLKRLAEHG